MSLRNKISSARRILMNDGVSELVKHTYSDFIRSYLPSVGYIERGMPIEREPIKVGKEKKLFDRYSPLLTSGYKAHTRIELGLRLGHIALTQPGDKVGIIGGGNGISATTAAFQVGDSGSVIVYDCMKGDGDIHFGISHIKKTVELNGVSDRCEAVLALVGTEEPVEGYGQHIDYDVPQQLPSELPEFDVLEFDCNGMEYNILKNMDIKPRALIIELEAPFYKEMWGTEHPKKVLDVLDEKGYTVIQRHGHEGRAITTEQLHKLIDIEFETEKMHELENGAKDSPILLALRKDCFE